jgi:hypothetical protein
MLASLLAVLGGCESITRAQRDRQLESIAKDWSMTIRASQVIPVYPMTEDLLPGDVFLVQRTVADQHKAYRDKGFLALENHLARLHPTGYANFYANSFLKKDESGDTLTRDWLTAGEAKSLARAPGAAFPAYSFSVSNGVGFSAALPVQGVPVGLSLLNSSSATGSITIDDARTYGVDVMTLMPDIEAWANKAETQAFLAQYVKTEKNAEPNYVRVVSRVYVTGKLNVSLNTAASGSGGGSVGVPKAVDLPLMAAPAPAAGADDAARTAATTKATAEGYVASLKGLNDALNAADARDEKGNLLPGGTLKVVAAGARSISIDETFTRPVVIGYLGFDMAILPGGVLGPPIATHAVLERKGKPSKERSAEVASALATVEVGMFQAVDALRTSTVEGVADKATNAISRADEASRKVLPTTYPVPTYIMSGGALRVQSQVGEEQILEGSPYRNLHSYAGELRSSLQVIRSAGTSDPLYREARSNLARTDRELDAIETALIPINRQLEIAFADLLGSPR